MRARSFVEVGLGLLLVMLALGACTQAVIPAPPELSRLDTCVAMPTNEAELREAIDSECDIWIENDITLESGELVLDRNITVSGPMTGVTISGNNASRVFHVTGATVTLRNLTITGGNHWYGGGGIYNHQGTLTIENSTITANTASFAGGGIWNEGILTIEDSTITANTAWQNDRFGRGGGVHSTAFMPEFSTTIVNSTIAGNTAYHGGGLFNYDGLTRILYSTVTDNQAVDGGGVWSYNDESTRTVVKGSIIVGNTLVDGTTANDVAAADDPAIRYSSLGYNLIGAAGDYVDFSQEFNLATDVTEVAAADLDLGPLADNGGPTFTHALRSDSLALDKIPEADCTDHDDAPVATDQRGVARPQGSACDVGAYELVQTAPSFTSSCTYRINPRNGQFAVVVAWAHADPGVTKIEVADGKTTTKQMAPTASGSWSTSVKMAPTYGVWGGTNRKDTSMAWVAAGTACTP
jgi:hypothetical protein